jgi:hypothetical protein
MPATRTDAVFTLEAMDRWWINIKFPDFLPGNFSAGS